MRRAGLVGLVGFLVYGLIPPKSGYDPDRTLISILGIIVSLLVIIL